MAAEECRFFIGVLTENERKVFDFLADSFDSDYPFYAFGSLANETGLDRKQVREACRSLRAKGLAEYRAGLFDDDGKPWGSGYRATRANVLEIAETK